MGRGRGGSKSYARSDACSDNRCEEEAKNDCFEDAPVPEKNIENEVRPETNELDEDDANSKEAFIERLNPSSGADQKVFKEGEFLITAKGYPYSQRHNFIVEETPEDDGEDADDSEGANGQNQGLDLSETTQEETAQQAHIE